MARKKNSIRGNIVPPVIGVSPAVRFIKDRRTTFRYFAVIRNGEDWRGFDDFSLMCELMGLDETITRQHFDQKGYFSGHEFTVFRFQPESKTSHRGHFY
jgi:hypothetical protein